MNVAVGGAGKVKIPSWSPTSWNQRNLQDRDPLPHSLALKGNPNFIKIDRTCPTVIVVWMFFPDS